MTVRDPELRERLTIAKMNTVISGSPLDETLAAAVLANREKVLSARRGLLASVWDNVATWVGSQEGVVEWVKPDGGALCCLHLSPKVFDKAGVDRFWAVLRLGFGYLPIEILLAALDALSQAVHAAARPLRPEICPGY